LILLGAAPHRLCEAAVIDAPSARLGRIVGLIETAAAFATDVLNPGGTFLAKAFQSGADAELVAQLKRDFASVRHVKPASSRQDSSERYVLAMGFRGHRNQP
jgi:23S rRNA (uridine2552-2'-O)-methyltransferase